MGDSSHTDAPSADCRSRVARYVRISDGKDGRKDSSSRIVFRFGLSVAGEEGWIWEAVLFPGDSVVFPRLLRHESRLMLEGVTENSLHLVQEGFFDEQIPFTAVPLPTFLLRRLYKVEGALDAKVSAGCARVAKDLDEALSARSMSNNYPLPAWPDVRTFHDHDGDGLFDGSL